MSYELEVLDCNCNNCIFMYRDMEEYKKWHDWHKSLDEREFNKRKNKAISDAMAIGDENQRNGMLRVANKMRFLFEKKHLINYGKCSRFGKSVSFLPNTIQIDTQECFVHRRDFKNGNYISI